MYIHTHTPVIWRASPSFQCQRINVVETELVYIFQCIPFSKLRITFLEYNVYQKLV